MTRAARSAADDFVELRFHPGTWRRKGIPEQGCWIRQSDLEAMIEAGGSFSVPQLAHCLIDWLAFTDDTVAAKSTLHRLIDRHFPDPDGSKPLENSD